MFREFCLVFMRAFVLLSGEKVRLYVDCSRYTGSENVVSLVSMMPFCRSLKSLRWRVLFFMFVRFMDVVLFSVDVIFVVFLGLLMCRCWYTLRRRVMAWSCLGMAMTSSRMEISSRR